MKRREWCQRAQLGEHAIVHHRGANVIRAAVYHPVSDRIGLGHGTPAESIHDLVEFSIAVAARELHGLSSEFFLAFEQRGLQA